MSKIDELKEVIAKSKNIVVFTGAGISCPAPSNIADFRSDNGLYNEKGIKYRPEEIISHSFFMAKTKEFYEFYGAKMVYPNALPNKAHFYFSDLEKQGKVKAVVTQNIDGLHSKAGSKTVYELHGSVYRNYCMKCHRFYDLKDINVHDIPYCECGGIIKPDVVLYEEGLDDTIVEKSVRAISQCDTLIVVGTSLVVYPAAGLLRYFNGTNLILINKQSTPYDDISTLTFNEDIIKVINDL